MTTGEAAILLLVGIMAATIGVTSVAGGILARERREWQIKFDGQAQEITSLRAQVKTLTDIVIANYPSAAVAINAGESVTVGQGVMGRDRNDR